MSSIIQQRTDKVESLIKEIKDHPMCFDFIDQGSHYIVIYPDGFQLDGCRIEITTKGETLEKLLNKIELHWKESFPGYKRG